MIADDETRVAANEDGADDIAAKLESGMDATAKCIAMLVEWNMLLEEEITFQRRSNLVLYILIAVNFFLYLVR